MVIKGRLTFSGDKSISHRALMFSALANGESRISNLSTGADVQSTRKCLEACGVKIRDEGNEVVVNGGKLSDPIDFIYFTTHFFYKSNVTNSHSFIYSLAHIIDC